MEETGFLFSCFCAPVFPNVPSQPGMPCQGEDSEYFFLILSLILVARSCFTNAKTTSRTD